MRNMIERGYGRQVLCLIALIIGLGCFITSDGWAVFITPMQVNIESGDRVSDLVISNQSTRPQMITLEWERRAMKYGGKMVKLKEGVVVEGYRPADPYLRFSPRRVILIPKESQKIRIIARRTPDMTEGEYHSHLLIKQDDLPKIQEKEEYIGEGVKGQIKVKVYSSIPVFLRHNKTSVDMSIEKAVIERSGEISILKMSVKNNSTRSLYPRVVLQCSKPDGETEERKVNVMRVYSESEYVEGEFKLKDFDKGQCLQPKAQIIGDGDFEVNGQVLSEKNVTF